MLTDTALNRMLRSLGAERRRVEQEIRRLEKLAEQEEREVRTGGDPSSPAPTRWRHVGRRPS